MSVRPDPSGWPSLILGGLATDEDPLAYANSVIDKPEAYSILKEAHSAMLSGDVNGNVTGDVTGETNITF